MNDSLKFSMLIPLLIATICTAADIKVDFEIEPSAIRQNESATATFTVHGAINPPRPALDEVLKDFDVQSLGTKRVSYNGYPTYSYSYRLRARKKGEFTIGPFLYRYKNQEIEVPFKKLKVVGIGEKTGLEITNSELLFATIETSKTNLVTQEYFDFDVVLYWRQVSLSGDVSIIDYQTPGLQFGQFRGTRTTEQQVNGNTYFVSRFRNKVKALAKGTYTIAPTVSVSILVSRRNSIFRDTKTLKIAVEPTLIDIVAPPESNRPNSFRGAVGKYQFNAQVSPLEMNEGTPITIRMQLSGSGNLDSALPPEITDEGTFKIYDSRLTEDRLNESKTEGRRLFEQVIEPRTPDIKEIPALEFSYYDPENAQYRTIRRGPFPIIITPMTNQVAREIGPMIVNNPAQKEIFGEYIEYLKPLPDHWKNEAQSFWLKSPLSVGVQVLPAVFAIFCFMHGRRKESLVGDIEKARRLEAPKVARAAVRRAQAAQKEGDISIFYEAASEALNGYLANKLNIGAGEVSMPLMRTRIDPEKHGNLLNQLEAFTIECETQRFSPEGLAASSPVELQEKLDQLTTILKACERIKT